MSQLVSERYPKIASGRKVVAAGGTAEALSATSVRCSRIQVMAETNNTNNVVVGDANIVAATGSERGIALRSTDPPVTIYASDLADVYVDAVTNSEGVTFVYYPE